MQVPGPGGGRMHASLLGLVAGRVLELVKWDAKCALEVSEPLWKHADPGANGNDDVRYLHATCAAIVLQRRQALKRAGYTDEQIADGARKLKGTPAG